MKALTDAPSGQQPPVLALPDAAPPPALALLDAPAAPIADDSSEAGGILSDSDGHGAAEGEGPKDPEGGARPAGEPPGSDADSDSPSVMSSSSGTSDSSRVVADMDEECDVWPIAVLGCALRFEDHDDGCKAGAKHQKYKRLEVRCPHHKDCGRFRNCHAKQMRRHGKKEPVAFLGAWVQAGPRFATKDDRKKVTPSDADVDAFVATDEW